jgi:homoserine O-acetyltransferase/O-succinyltransferase
LKLELRVRATLAVLGGIVLCIATRAAAAQARAPLPAPHVASLGTCRLAEGGTIPSCRVAYRSFGALNQSRTNTILIPTWLLGRSDDWVPFIGSDGFVDTTQYHVILVDALGDGLSSSPSNTRNASTAFAHLTVGDMVQSQYRLLTERLGITHLRAVLGFSMGGMQAIEWAVRHPDFVDKIVPIAGASRVGTFDRLMWTAMLNEIDDGMRAHTPSDSIWARLAHMEMLFVQTPIGVNAKVIDSVEGEIATNARGYRTQWKLEDYAAQLRAIRRYDVRLSQSEDMQRSADRVRARVLAVYSWDDHMVTAGSVAEFARMVHADTLSVRSPCGHVMLFCEQARVAPAIRAFIAR